VIGLNSRHSAADSAACLPACLPGCWAASSSYDRACIAVPLDSSAARMTFVCFVFIHIQSTWDLLDLACVSPAFLVIGLFVVLHCMPAMNAAWYHNHGQVACCLYRGACHCVCPFAALVHLLTVLVAYLPCIECVAVCNSSSTVSAQLHCDSPRGLILGWSTHRHQDQ